MANIGPTELIVVLIIALLVLGPKRLPAAARSLGHGIREFKDSIAAGPASDDVARTDASVAEDASAQPARQTSMAG